MSYQDQLTREINGVLDRLEEQKHRLVADWVTVEICDKHAEGLATNEHREFWHFCGYSTTRDEVRRCINVRRGDKPESSSSRQHWLPGFVHLQPYYLVERDGKEVGIPTPELEDDELLAKATLYRSMAAGCNAHANEIDRYVEERQAKKPADVNQLRKEANAKLAHADALAAWSRNKPA